MMFVVYNVDLNPCTFFFFKREEWVFGMKSPLPKV